MWVSIHGQVSQFTTITGANAPTGTSVPKMKKEAEAGEQSGGRVSFQLDKPAKPLTK
jgi:hypothetical protein